MPLLFLVGPVVYTLANQFLSCLSCEVFFSVCVEKAMVFDIEMLIENI